MIGIGGKSFGDVEEFGFGEANQGTAKQRTECERIARVRDRAGYRNEILNLLSPEEAFSGLRRNRDSALFECFLEPPQVGANRREQRDVTKAAGPPDAACTDARGSERSRG